MKGCQKKVIFLKNTGSYLFDEAYFIISREGERTPASEESMIDEANRIIEDSMDNGDGYNRAGVKIRRVIGALLPFFAGAAVTAVGFTLWMLF